MTPERVALIQVDPDASINRLPFRHYNTAEPLGLLCLAATLENAGCEVLVIHPEIDNPQVFSRQEIVKRIAEFKPRIVGFSCMTRQVSAAHAVAEELKSCIPDLIVIVGGDHFSSIPADISKFAAFDIVVCGEGESSILWLVENLENNWTVIDVPQGIYWKSEGKVNGEGISERICTPDTLPSAKRYHQLLKNSHVGALMYPSLLEQRGMISVYASRGCPFNCSYCDAAQVWGRHVTWRSPESVVEELREAKRQYGVNTAFFVDLTFNATKSRLLSLCSELAKADLGVSWYVLLRPGAPNSPLYIGREVLKALKDAGCTKVGFGVETISLEVSKDLNRLKGNGHLVEACRHMDELGLLSKAFFIIGHPAETKEYYSELAMYLRELKVDEIRVSFLTPFPGTPLWQSYKDVLPGHEGYEAYSTFQPLIPHPSFSPIELQRLRLKMIREYYESKKYCHHVADKIDKHGYLKESFSDFRRYIDKEIRKAESWLTGTEVG
jgi:radical SAM superfamily enzyme YgiQ (UPF0313 family)